MPFINVKVSRPPTAELARTIAQGVVAATADILHKDPAVTSVAVSFVPPEHWIVGGRSLAQQGLASFWLDIKVSDGTNTKDEKARYLAAVFAFMGTVLGALHEESYILIHDARADAYGYGGVTQEQRYIQAKLSA